MCSQQMHIRIFHILDTLNVGGLENGVVNLINGLDYSKFSHTLCVLRKIGVMAKRIKRSDIEIICLDNTSRDYFMPLRLKRIITRCAPDVVHTRNWGTIDGILAARLAGVKNIIHGEHGREYADLAGLNFKRKIFRWAMSPAVKYFVAVSKEITLWLRDTIGIPEDKIVTIINGVDTQKFHPPADKKRAKQGLGLNPDAFIVGTVGRLDKVKNYPMLLKAFHLSKTNHPPMKLLFVGDGPQRRNLEEFVRRNQIVNVEFLGQRENVADYLKCFDLFVLPSLAEGISNTILEAMATGVSVVATNIGGNPEILEEGVTGSLILSGDYIALWKTIVKYLNDRNLCESHGKAARLRCENLFSLNFMVKKYDELYTSMIQNV